MNNILYRALSNSYGEQSCRKRHMKVLKETKQCFEESFQVSDFYDRQTQDS